MNPFFVKGTIPFLFSVFFFSASCLTSSLTSLHYTFRKDREMVQGSYLSSKSMRPQVFKLPVRAASSPHIASLFKLGTGVFLKILSWRGNLFNKLTNRQCIWYNLCPLTRRTLVHGSPTPKPKFFPLDRSTWVPSSSHKIMCKRCNFIVLQLNFIFWLPFHWE